MPATATDSDADDADDANVEERLLTGYTGRLFVVLSIGWTSIQLGRQVLPPLLPAIIDDLAITPSKAGFALTLMGALYAAAHYPSGRFSDRLSRRTILVVGIVVMTVGFFALSRVASYPALLFGVGLVGLGAALYFVPLRASIADLFVERRGQAFGLNNAAGVAGNVLAAGLAVAVLSVATWRAAFLPVMVLLAVILVLLHAWSREPYVVARVELGLRETAGRVFGTARIRWLVVAYSMFVFTWRGVVGFLPTFLQVDKGFSSALASGGFAMLFIVGAISMPLAGQLGDRLSRLPVAAGSLLLGAVGLAGVLIAPSALLVIVGIVVFAVGLMAFPPVMQSYLMDAFPDDSMGGDFGAFKTIYTGVGSIGPTYVGLIAERSSYTTALGGIAISLLVGAAIIFWLINTD